MKSLAVAAGLLLAGLVLRSVAANRRRVDGIVAARTAEWNDPTWRAELADQMVRTIVSNTLPHRKGS